MKKKLIAILSIILIAAMLFGCAPKAQPTPTAEVTEPPATVAPKKVVLIGAQRFGDKGPMDSMAAGLDQCATDFGFEVKKIESDSAAAYEEDIRGMANEGYDLIITTFPPMTDPTKTIAAEFPNTKFAAIYQFINVEGTSIPNIWDTEFHGEQAFYILGAIATKLSKTKKVAIIEGSETLSNNAQLNGFFKGVKDNCPECEASYAIVGSYEDPAKAKVIALALIESGVDVIQTDAANSQIGVIEASKEKGTLVSGDVSDNTAMYPEGFFGYVGVSFGANVYQACKYLAEDKYPGGEHGIMNLTNNGYFVPFDVLENFAVANPDYKDSMAEAIALAKDLSNKLASGEIVVDFITTLPASK